MDIMTTMAAITQGLQAVKTLRDIMTVSNLRA